MRLRSGLAVGLPASCAPQCAVWCRLASIEWWLAGVRLGAAPGQRGDRYIRHRVPIRVSFTLITTYRGPIPPFCKICGWNTIDFGHGMIIAEGHRDR